MKNDGITSTNDDFFSKYSCLLIIVTSNLIQKRINSCIANNWIINRTTDVVRANLSSPPFSFHRKRDKENVQRTQITFSSDKASLPRTRHDNVSRASRAILSLKAACSTLDLVRATCQYPSLSVFSVEGHERRGPEEKVSIFLAN